MATNNPTPGTTPAGEKQRSSADAARENARSAADEARHQASHVADRAREGLREGVASAQEQARQRANGAVERAADEVSRTSEALESSRRGVRRRVDPASAAASGGGRPDASVRFTARQNAGRDGVRPGRFRPAQSRRFHRRRGPGRLCRCAVRARLAAEPLRREPLCPIRRSRLRRSPRGAVSGRGAGIWRGRHGAAFDDAHAGDAHLGRLDGIGGCDDAADDDAHARLPDDAGRGACLDGRHGEHDGTPGSTPGSTTGSTPGSASVGTTGAAPRPGGSTSSTSSSTGPGSAGAKSTPGGGTTNTTGSNPANPANKGKPNA